LPSPMQSRRSAILELLHQRDVVFVNRLSTRFGVSSMTIRRDLAALEKAGDLRRVRGGAIPASDGPNAKDSSLQPTLNDEALPRLEDHPDVLVLNPLDSRMARMIVQRATRHGIPIITESIPFDGTTTLIAIDSFRAGVSLGKWVGEYVRDQMKGIVRVLFVGMPSFSDTADRERGFFEGLQAIIPQNAFALSINGGGLRKRSYAAAMAALSIYPDINVIIGANDQSALGALDALRELQLVTDKLLLGTFGLEGHKGKSMLMSESPRCAGVAMFPEFIGRVCADVAVKAYSHMPLPRQGVTPTTVVTSETLPRYYDRVGGRWEIRWNSVQNIAEEGWTPEAALLTSSSVVKYPKRLDFVRYLHDEYYDQLVQGLKERAGELGVMVRVADASADLAASIALVRRAIGKAAAALVEPGEAVILDAGTTATYMAQELAKRRDGSFTVISNSVPVIDALKDAPNIVLVGIGGILHRASQSFLGAEAERSLNALRGDKAFLSAAAVNVEYGLSTTDLAEAEFKRCIQKAAKHIVLLADSFKFGEISLARVGPISLIHKLVTDDQISPKDRLALTRAGIEVILS